MPGIFTSKFIVCLAAVLTVGLSSCMKWDYDRAEDITADGQGLFILNEGNFQYGNATLSYYSPETGTVENEVFARANGMKLGDVAQSMTVHGGLGWIVVNNSHVVFAIDLRTFREVGRITNLPSPRYIHFVSPRKAYISQIWDNRIAVVDPATYSITGYITVPDMASESGSTEQMLQVGRYVYCTCWSYQSRVIKIDTATDQVVGQLEVGAQPSSLTVDALGRLWALCDGGYDGSPSGNEAPRLVRINPDSFSVETMFTFDVNRSPSELQTNGAADTLYWINDDIWRMPVTAEALPSEPFLAERSTKYYGLTVDPVNSQVYVADAIDHQQQGMIYRYTPQGEQIDNFRVGISPGAYCWTK